MTNPKDVLRTVVNRCIAEGAPIITNVPAVPNFDAMEPHELMAFWQAHQNGRRFAELFPGRPAGTRRAVADLANYAANKATAIACRMRGDIQTALQYEDICDRIYNDLPAFARW
jgi:hypothetical protein